MGTHEIASYAPRVLDGSGWYFVMEVDASAANVASPIGSQAEESVPDTDSEQGWQLP